MIALSRPALSLAPSALQHTYALETCVASARVILRTLSREFEPGKRKAVECCGLPGAPEVALMWPGYVDMVFFAALILVYAAKREEMGADA